MSDATPPPSDPTFAPQPAFPPVSPPASPGGAAVPPGQPTFPPAAAPGQGYPAPSVPSQPGYPQYGQPEAPPASFGQPAYGQPQPGQPAYGPPQPGQPGQPGYPQPGYPAYQGLGTPAPKKRSTLKIVLLVVGLAGVLLVGLGVFGVSAIVSAAADPAKGAKVGDCLSATGTVADSGISDTSADIVDCSSVTAEYTVVARIEGESSPTSTACDKFFPGDERFFVYGSTAGDGYVLCLRPKG
ncbi:LppU/SCO3897 family protein [Paractinoplanes lichenicola]|uniref:Uncharacterized protein n=1 Tax=Paractinoplanes lichenicola TaxID=2802976 RepID=A0ABS1VQA1_9ACTN|nr:hypothetical protein [Actinoplanes lichenicola]MBL7256899.1 hypothetical protein [Actinoplanes lichenicola]